MSRRRQTRGSSCSKAQDQAQALARVRASDQALDLAHQELRAHPASAPSADHSKLRRRRPAAAPLQTLSFGRRPTVHHPRRFLLASTIASSSSLSKISPPALVQVLRDRSVPAHGLHSSSPALARLARSTAGSRVDLSTQASIRLVRSPATNRDNHRRSSRHRLEADQGRSPRVPMAPA